MAEAEVEGARDVEVEADERAASDFRSFFAARRPSFDCTGVDVPDRVAERDSGSALEVASSVEGRSFSFSRLAPLLARFSAFFAAFSSFFAFFAAFSASRSALDRRFSCFDSSSSRFRFLLGSSTSFPFPFDARASSSSTDGLSTDPRKKPL